MQKLLYHVNSDMTNEMFSCRIMNLSEKKNKINTASKCNDILNQYNCTLDVSMLISQKGVVPQVQILPKMEN